MSEQIMSDEPNPPDVPRAINRLHQAQIRNEILQKKFAAGSPEWHDCETVDDYIHAALSALGD